MSVRRIETSSRLCAVIGHPIAHSLSPAIHNAAFDALDLDFVYVAFDVRDVPGALAGVRALGLRGLSVTLPHKVAVFDALDAARLDASALDTGAVNTVVNEDGVLRGYNTDGPGAHRALVAAGVDPAEHPCVLIGAGGAARGIAFHLARHGSPGITVLARRAQAADALAADLRAVTRVPIAAAGLGDEDVARALAPEGTLLIQTTPVGMHPQVDASPLAEGALRPDHVVFDIVYNPVRTRLLAFAEARGARTLGGAEMFVWQAAAQFTLWTGREAPVDVMRGVLAERLGGPKP